MSGPTDTQTELQQEQIDAYQQAGEMTKQQYANQQAIYAPMVSQFQSIYAKGPNQGGFSSAEKENLNAQAVEGTAGNYAAAARAVGEQEASLGGGTNPLPSGAQAQLKEEVANSAAAHESSEESQIAQADYSQGYDEWENAGKGLQTIAAGADPVGYENAATSSGSAASKTASDIASEDDEWVNAAIGAAGEIGGGLAGNPKLCWIAAELWGGWNDPRTVKVRSWMTHEFMYTPVGKVVVPFYAQHGERVAQAIRRWPVLRRVFQPLFNWALRKAER